MKRTRKFIMLTIVLTLALQMSINSFAKELDEQTLAQETMEFNDSKAAIEYLADVVDDESCQNVMQIIDGREVESLTSVNGKYLLINLEGETQSKYSNSTMTETTEEVETILMVASTSTVPGSLSYQTGRYDVAATFTSNITWLLTRNAAGEIIDYKVKFNNIKEKIVDAGANPIYVTKIVHEVAMLDMNSINTYYTNSNTVNNPTSGVEYTKTLNSSWIPFIDHISNFFDLYFSNGDHLQVERSSAELH